MKIPPLLILTGFVALLSPGCSDEISVLPPDCRTEGYGCVSGFQCATDEEGSYACLPVDRSLGPTHSISPESRGGEEPAPLNPGEEDPLVDAGMKDSAEDGTEASVPDGESTFPEPDLSIGDATPVEEDDSGDGSKAGAEEAASELSLEDACSGLPEILLCDPTVIPDFYTFWSEAHFQPAGQILVFPFRVEASTTASGKFSLKTFMSAVDDAVPYDFDLWVSDTPNGSLLNGEEDGIWCRFGAKTALLRSWEQVEGSGSSYTCNLGTEERILFLNAKLSRVEDDGSETLYPGNLESWDAVKWTLAGSTLVEP